MGLVENIANALRFKDTIIYKGNSDLQNRYDALCRLKNEFSDNKKILEELYIVKKGLEGENEIEYQLKKASIGMYVLRDFKLKYEDMVAQIDYVVITPLYTYYLECKNLLGNIYVNEAGDFIREYVINGKKVKKGMYSPLRQVEAQREVVKKFWLSRRKTWEKILYVNSFEKYRKTLVVVANHETILNTTKAPKEIKHNVLRADALVKHIQYDLEHRKKDEMLYSKNEMEDTAKSYLEVSVTDNINYYEYYKEKYCKNMVDLSDLKGKLIEFRKIRAKELNIPAYYIFNNDELDDLINKRPKTIEELKKFNILSEIKVKKHGKEIINLINSRNEN